MREVFDTPAAATKENVGLQILVLDHASKEVWGDVDVHFVDEWRDGKALVPKAWIPNGTS